MSAGQVPCPQVVRLGLIAGVAIGVVAALMGVSGGQLLIPTIVLLYGLDIKLAGSLSLAVSLPTMLVAFARYCQDASFQIPRSNKDFVLTMTSGPIARTLSRHRGLMRPAFSGQLSRANSRYGLAHRKMLVPGTLTPCRRWPNSRGVPARIPSSLAT